MNAKVPIIVVSSLLCLALGAAGGVGAMVLFGYYWAPQPQAAANPPDGVTPGKMMMGGQGGPPGGMMMGAKGGGPPGGMAGGKGGGPPGGMFGGAGGPSPKTQLVSLVTKLDLLTQKPPTLHLDGKKQDQLREQLQGLDEMEELADADAKKRVEAILEIVESEKATLQAVGFNWPGAGGGFKGKGKDVPNPFKEEPNSKALTSLQKKLEKSKSN